MASVTINGKEYPMALTTRAVKVIGQRFGGLESIGSALYDEQSIEKKIDIVIELVELLINEAAARHNIFEPQETKWEAVTKEFLEIATSPSELSDFAPAIKEALNEGMVRHIESEKDSKN